MSYIQQQQQQQQSTGINRPLNFAATNNRHVQQQRATTTKQLSNQGSNLNRSCSQLSGSDTDVSTSNENLSNEERYVIKHTARQEPQGQENQQHSPSRSSSHCKESSIPNIQQQQQQGNSNSSTSSLLNRNSLKDDASNCSNRNSFRQSSLSAGSNRNSLKDSINGNSNRNSLKDNLSSSNRTSIGSNRSSLDVSTSSYNTLIIHNQANEDNLWAPSSAVAAAAALPSSSSSRLSGVIKEHGDMGAAYHVYENDTEIGRDHSNFALDDHSFYSNTINSGCQEITDIPDDYLNQSQVLKHLAKEVRVPSYNKLAGDDQQCTEISEGGDGSNSNRISEGDSLRQNEFDSSLPSNCYRRRQLYTTTATTALPISLTSKQDFIGQTEKLAFSRSQPDLSRISKLTLTDGGMDNYDFQQTTSPRPQTKGREEFETWPTSEMVQILIQENSALKLELDRCYKKVAKSQQLEKEIAKVHRAHEELVASSERREKLERAARSRLQSDCRRLTELNRALRDQIELLSTRAESSHSIDALRKELSQKELFIGQLITQTKELAAAKERQEIELAAQRATLQEQRTHIDILDTALTNAQSNVVRLEEECRKNKVYVERVGQLQRALSSLQASSDRREETERQLRDQLERELREGAAAAAAAVAAGTSLSAAREGSSLATANGETVHELKRKLRERNEKIMSLEGDVAKWEQRYLEESALRQAAIDAASLPKDAKIAALEKTSQDAEKLLAEAHSEKLRQMDQVHAAQKKLADLESRMKDLESKLAERDAMIRVLQKHTYDKAAAAAADSSSGGYQAMHSSHSSTSAVDHHHHHHHHHTALTSAPELVSSVLGGGSGYSSSSTASYGVGSAADAYKYGSTSSSSSSRKQASFEQTNKSLDDQLKELDSQLLSKRALCCFPGFSNPGAPSRKGKIPKPLLASVDRLAGSSSSGGKSRLLNAAEGLARDEPEAASMLSASNAILDLAVAASRFKSRFSDEVCSGVGGKPAEDMMLLEKQGRSSQRQRMSSSQEPNQQQQHQQHQQQQLENRRAGSLPPSSLPRPPRAFGAGKNAAGRYCRLSDSEQTARKKPPAEAAEVYRFESPSPSHAAKLSLLRRKQSSENVLLSDAEDYHQRQHHKQPYRDSAGNCKKSVGQYERLGGAVSTTSGHPRSLIPPPPASSNSSSRRYGAIHPEYGRLSDSAAAEPKSSPLQLQQPIRGQSTGSIVSIKSCDTSSAMLKSSNRSIPRPSNYKIQF